MGVISCVEGANDKVNNLVIVEKKDGSLRWCLDPVDLNHAYISNQFNHPPSPEQIFNNEKGKKSLLS